MWKLYLGWYVVNGVAGWFIGRKVAKKLQEKEVEKWQKMEEDFQGLLEQSPELREKYRRMQTTSWNPYK